MTYPWASGAWASGALASGSWLVSSSHAGVSWALNSWGPSTWASGSWLEAWASAGNYSLNGQSINFFRTYILSATVGSYTETGFNTAYNLNAKVGTTSLNGQAVALTANTYRVTSVNTNNEVVDDSTGIQINGSNLTGTTSVKLQYAKGQALKVGSWVSGTSPAWATNVWADGTTGVNETALANVSVVNNNLITANMVDVETSPIPFTDVNHASHRIYISDGTRSNFFYIQVQPDQFNTIGTVQPADAITTSGQSIFSGLTLNANMQVMLPVVIGGANTTWETSNGNITGRVTLSSTLSSPATISIPIWDDNIGWDVINVTIKDISSVNTTMPADVGTFNLTGESVSWKRDYVLAATCGVFNSNGQSVNLSKRAFLQPSSFISATSVSQPLVVSGITISSVSGIGADIIQSGSNFNINGVGFGDINATTVTLVDFANTLPCQIIQINNSYIQAKAPTNAGALSNPTYLVVDNGTAQANRQVSVVVFNINSLVSATLTSVPTITQKNVVNPDSLISATQLSNSAFAGGNTSLVVSGLVSTTTLGISNLIQHNSLIVDGLTSATTISPPSLSQHFGLFTGSMVSASSLSNAQLTYYSVVAASLNSTTLLGSPSLIQQTAGASSNITSLTKLDSPSITQKNVIAPNGLTSSISVESPSLTNKAFLNVDGLNSYSLFGNTSVVGRYSLNVNDITSTTSLYDSNVSHNYSLLVGNITSITTLDGTTLIQKNYLDVEDLHSKSVISRVNITQRYSVTVDDLTSVTTLFSSRSKISADPIFINKITSSPAFVGELSNK